MKKVLFAIFFICTFFTTFAKEIASEEIETVDNSIVIDRIENTDIEVTLPSMIFTFKEAEIKLRFVNPNHTKLLLNKGKISFIININKTTFNKTVQFMYITQAAYYRLVLPELLPKIKME